MMKNASFRFLSILLLTLITLSACGKGNDSPEEVLLKAKEALMEVDSGRVMATADLMGQGSSDNVNLDVNFQMAFDEWTSSTKKMDVQAKLSGLMNAQDKAVNGDLDLNFIAIGSQYYLKLNQLASNDESVAAFLPFIDQYKSKWLRIAEDFIPQNIRNLQNQTPETQNRQDQMEELFTETKFFHLAQDYGVEELDGQRVYHYELTPDQDAFKQYMSKASLIDGQALTNAELEQSVAFLESLDKVEFFIDINNYSPRKAIFSFVDRQAAGSSLEVALIVETADFNKSVKVEAPESYEDFNPLNLMMGLGSLPSAQDFSLPENIEQGSDEGDGADSLEEAN